ncbi:sensor histidine kinase [Kibdelosporangium aridum]|uniref:sensor histidine kinase n=1 Tax=Kibdelosporangium aridum TaxID=2030 RepID=UPI000F7B338E|nr:histidine kinase [Kibdelosporangium aridum]
MRRELLGRWILPIRLVPLALGFGYMLLLHGSLQPTPAGWTATICSTLLITIQGRWPLVATLLLSVLVFGFQSVQLGQGVATMASLFALGELSWRRGGWQMWLGATAVLLAGMFRPNIDGVVPEIFAAVVITALPVLLGMHLRSVQEIAWQAKELSASEAQAARAEERTAIARELHDLVAHHVASMVLRIGVARHVLKTDPKVAEILDEVHKSGTAAMTDLKTLVSVLRSSEPLEATDLVNSLNAAVERVAAAGPDVRAEIDPKVGDVDAVVRLAVLRVVQEGLTNVLKHAGPKAKVSLRITREDHAVDVMLRDDAPNPPQAAEPGHGLIGMRERVELVGGKLVTGPVGTGWRVHAWLPA